MSGCGYSRRQFLAGAAGLLAWAHQTRIAAAEPGRDPRLLVLNLRGGMDGLGAVAPMGDPDFHRLREGATFADCGLGNGFRLDNMFSLHPSLPGLSDIYGRGEAAILHATCSPYQDRSHFVAQDILESGLPGVGDYRTGWLNRAMKYMKAGERITPAGLALKSQVPLLMRGEAEVTTWVPAGGRQVSDDLKRQLAQFYQHSDRKLHQSLEMAIQNDDFLEGLVADAGHQKKTVLRKVDYEGAIAVGEAMAREDGPRIGSIELDGWDTHAEGMPNDPRFLRQLAMLDEMIAALRTSLAHAWDQTVIIVMTEFGRTVRINGHEGTDHGVGTVALLVGGAVNGGRVLSDWPGLSPDLLHEGRDLRPTTDIRSLFKGVLRDHLGLEEEVLAREIFPLSRDIRPLDGTIRT